MAQIQLDPVKFGLEADQSSVRVLYAAPAARSGAASLSAHRCSLLAWGITVLLQRRSLHGRFRTLIQRLLWPRVFFSLQRLSAPIGMPALEFEFEFEFEFEMLDDAFCGELCVKHVVGCSRLHLRLPVVVFESCMLSTSLFFAGFHSLVMQLFVFRLSCSLL
jgi:hypothetical protein